MKIVLIGGMASGKTTIGRKLAELLQSPFFDTDSWIEAQYKMPVATIFKTYGESAFRAHETEALQYFLQKSPASLVLATGGGIVKKPENRVLLSKHGTVIYLKVSVDTQLARTEGDTTRPLLLGVDKREVLTRLNVERAPWYAETAQLTISVDHSSPLELANTLAALIR